MMAIRIVRRSGCWSGRWDSIRRSLQPGPPWENVTTTKRNTESARPETMSRTEPALRRALALDPNLEDAAQQIVSLDADAGKLAQAYQEAKAMVEKRPQSGFAHFTLSYVLRYASLTKEAAEECDTAMRLDPGNYQFRSCASVFYPEQSVRSRAGSFGELDAGSEWSNNVEVNILLREGKTNEALAEAAPAFRIARSSIRALWRLVTPRLGLRDPNNFWSRPKRRFSLSATRNPNTVRRSVQRLPGE